jgi:hypothetical protein
MVAEPKKNLGPNCLRSVSRPGPAALPVPGVNRGLHVPVIYITISPGHQNSSDNTKETIMTTQISSKLAALGIALIMNGLMLGSIAYLFDAQLFHQVPAVTTMVA